MTIKLRNGKKKSDGQTPYMVKQHQQFLQKAFFVFQHSAVIFSVTEKVHGIRRCRGTKRDQSPIWLRTEVMRKKAYLVHISAVRLLGTQPSNPERTAFCLTQTRSRVFKIWEHFGHFRGHLGVILGWSTCGHFGVIWDQFVHFLDYVRIIWELF